LNILYHFTTATNADAIKKNGLTKGVTPVNEDEKIAFIQHTQWLTIDPDVQNQSWATRGRTQAVVKVNIPVPLAKEKLIPFDIFCAALGERKVKGFDAKPELTKYWYVYLGTIPPQWIVSVRKIKE